MAKASQAQAGNHGAVPCGDGDSPHYCPVPGCWRRKECQQGQVLQQTDKPSQATLSKGHRPTVVEAEHRGGAQSMCPAPTVLQQQWQRPE
jgi:hypothetical protein